MQSVGRVVRHECGVQSMNLAAEFHCAIESRVDLYESTVGQLMKTVRRLPFAAIELEDIELALSEALANAILHGNRQDPDKQVRICGGYESSGGLVLTITDEGDGFDHDRIQDPRAGANLFSSHGRGILFIQHIMDSLEFRLGGRRLIMRKKAPGAVLAATAAGAAHSTACSLV